VEWGDLPRRRHEAAGAALGEAGVDGSAGVALGEDPAEASAGPAIGAAGDQGMRTPRVPLRNAW
jgi:hypothetical protein